VTVSFTGGSVHPSIRVAGQWRGAAPERIIHVPGFTRITLPAGDAREEFPLSPL
jgi:hypothetical protein